MSSAPPTVVKTTLNSTLPATARNDISPDQITHEHLLNYFALKPPIKFAWWVILLFVFSACSLCSGIAALASSGSQSGGAGAAVTGLFFLAVAVGIAAGAGFGAYNPVRRYNTRDTITDAAFDRWVNWQADGSLRRACDRLGLDFTRIDLPPSGPNAQLARPKISIRGFERAKYLVPIGGRGRFVISELRVGVDNYARWRRNVNIWFFPKDRKLATYKQTIDAVQYNETSDSTQEYFYQAVSGLSTSQERLESLDTTGYGSRVAVSATSFTLRIENGDTISTPVNLVEAHLKTLPSGLEEAVNSLRSLLDDTKYAQLGGAGGQGYPSGYGTPPGYGPGGYGPPLAGYPSGGYAPPPPGAGYAPGPSTPYPQAGYPATPYPATPYPATPYPAPGGETPMYPVTPPPLTDTTQPGNMTPDQTPGQGSPILAAVGRYGTPYLAFNPTAVTLQNLYEKGSSATEPSQ